MVSVIIPVYNEEKYIGRCLSSLSEQTYPKEDLEYLLIDGGSTDSTVSIIESYMDKLPVRILNNEKKLVTYALNLGISQAKGDYIVRVDAHSLYNNDYIEKCIYYLENTDADNVGGIAITKGEGFCGSANAEILSSAFGVGNSQFRIGAKSGYVDTVPFGAFRREIFDKIGLFNPELPRSEDNDFNSRIISAGGKVFLAADIVFSYFCRSTVSGLLNQGLKNGNSLFLTLRVNPHAMKLRHYIPFIFLLSLIILPVASAIFAPFGWLLAAEWTAYTLLDIYFSAKNFSIKSFFYKLVMYPLFHITYGAGSFIGMLGIRLY